MAEQVNNQGLKISEQKQDCGCGCGGNQCGSARSDCGCGCGGGLCGTTQQKLVWVAPEQLAEVRQRPASRAEGAREIRGWCLVDNSREERVSSPTSFS